MYTNVVGNIWKEKIETRWRKKMQKEKQEAHGKERETEKAKQPQKATKKDLLKRGGLLFSQRLNT